MTTTCGCCGGAETVAGAQRANRPGLSRIAYRAATWAGALDAMLARLSSAGLPELRALRTRDPADPAIALLDGWAVLADVLSFYNERIANENYLRTATERRSLLELARLTGYQLRPGVAASVYLAYELDPNAAPLTLPAGTRAQSIPGPGEQMQTFETAEPLEARAAWNALHPRLSQPQARTPLSVLSDGIWLQGTATQLKPNDALLVAFDNGAEPLPYKVDSVALDEAGARTRIGLRPWTAAKAKPQPAAVTVSVLGGIVKRLQVRPQVQPANSLRLARDATRAFAGGADVYPQLLQSLRPELAPTLYRALGGAPVTPPVPIRVYALRAGAALFGHNAPPLPQVPVIGLAARKKSAVAAVQDFIDPDIANTWGKLGHPAEGGLPVIPLDRLYQQVTPGQRSYLLIDRPQLDSRAGGPTPAVKARLSLHRIADVRNATMATLAGAAFEVTQVTLDLGAKAPLDGAWLAELNQDQMALAVNAPEILRGTRVYAQSEELALAEEPLADPVCDDGGVIHEIELDALYDGLQPGRWLILEGSRRDVDGVGQLGASELVMLAAVRSGVRQPGPPAGEGPGLAGDRLHTFITLARPLAYCYERASVALYANVVRATHGETRREALGGGDPAQAFQQLALKQPPLTFVAATTPDGVASTLEVRVDGLRWHEVAALAEAGPDAHVYISRRDNDEKTRVIFGDGAHGARPPGGADNLRAIYRNGIGFAGNVAAGQVTLATDKPLGVKGVRNPLRASGGAGPDRLEQARRNAPLAVMALDRLVSVQDYADFARRFAGIDKASARLDSDGRRRFVQVTVAGIDDLPIERSSDLFRNLQAALLRFGDPHLPLRLRVSESLALVLHARIALLPDYPWETVAPRVRAALVAGYGFASRDIGQPVLTSAIAATIQQVDGVDYALLDAAVLSQDQLVGGLAPSAPAGVAPGPAAPGDPCAGVRIAIGPGQLAYLSATVADALLLEVLP
ncbi:MAG: putative baseplate assembly protein [Massilia sp.]